MVTLHLKCTPIVLHVYADSFFLKEKPVSPEKAPRPAPPKRNVTAAAMPTAYETHTIAYENGSAPQPMDVTNLSHWAVKNVEASTTTSSAFTEQDLVSRKAVTTGNRTVETLTVLFCINTNKFLNGTT